MQTSTEPRSAQPRREFWLWVSTLAPPVIWLVQFQIKYSLAARTTTGARTAVILASVVSLLAVAGCGLMASRFHRLADASPLDAFARKGPRIRFMATLGVMSSGLFLLLMVAQLLADWFIKPGLQ
jgi:hypothetical protein